MNIFSWMQYICIQEMNLFNKIGILINEYKKIKYKFRRIKDVGI